MISFSDCVDPCLFDCVDLLITTWVCVVLFVGVILFSSCWGGSDRRLLAGRQRRKRGARGKADRKALRETETETEGRRGEEDKMMANLRAWDSLCQSLKVSSLKAKTVEEAFESGLPPDTLLLEAPKKPPRAPTLSEVLSASVDDPEIVQTVEFCIHHIDNPQEDPRSVFSSSPFFCWGVLV